jgi:predicted nucleic acid-binding protein
VLTLGELRKGVAALKLRDPDPNAANRLAVWVEGIEAGFSDRILGIDAATARLWGAWSAERPRPVVDTLLAATAVVNDLTLVTRNIRDVRDTPVKLHDPWTG